jgi:hypothetical protein
MIRRSAYGVLMGLALPVTSSIAAEPTPSANELFTIISAARETARSDRIVDPGAFSRERLERTLRNVDATADDPKREDLDWARDELLAGLAWLHTFDDVYSYELASIDGDPAALKLQVTTCGKKPRLLTLGFRHEEGLWRMNKSVSDSTPAATKWFHSGLKAIHVWPHVTSRDRSRYLNESPIGAALGLKLTPTKDGC